MISFATGVLTFFLEIPPLAFLLHYPCFLPNSCDSFSVVLKYLLRILSFIIFSLPKTLSLVKPIHSGYSTYSSTPRAGPLSFFLLSLLPSPGFPQTQYIKSELISCLCDPAFLAFPFGFSKFFLYMGVNFSWC